MSTGWRTLMIEIKHVSKWYGPVQVLNTPVILSRTPVQVRQTQAEVGEHNASVLSELGYTEQDIQQFIQQKAI